MTSKALPISEFGSALLYIGDHDKSADFLIGGFGAPKNDFYNNVSFLAKIDKKGNVIKLKELKGLVDDYHVLSIIFSEKHGYVFTDALNIWTIDEDLENLGGPYFVGRAPLKVMEDELGRIIVSVSSSMDGNYLKRYNSDFTADLNFGTSNGAIKISHSGHILDFVQTNNGEFIVTSAGSFQDLGQSKDEVTDFISLVSSDGKNILKQLNSRSALNLQMYQNVFNSAISILPSEHNTFYITGSHGGFEDGDTDIKSNAYLLEVDDDLNILNYKNYPQLCSGKGFALCNEGLLLLGLRTNFFNQKMEESDFGVMIVNKDLSYVKNSLKYFPGNKAEGTCWGYGIQAIGNGEIAIVSTTFSTDIGGDYSSWYHEKNVYFGYYKFPYSDSELQLLLFN